MARKLPLRMIDYPVGCIVCNRRYPKRWGVLVSYGRRAAKVRFGRTGVEPEWVPLGLLDMVPEGIVREKLRQELIASGQWKPAYKSRGGTYPSESMGDLYTPRSLL